MATAWCSEADVEKLGGILRHAGVNLPTLTLDYHIEIATRAVKAELEGYYDMVPFEAYTLSQLPYRLREITAYKTIKHILQSNLLPGDMSNQLISRYGKMYHYAICEVKAGILYDQNNVIIPQVLSEESHNPPEVSYNDMQRVFENADRIGEHYRE